MQNKSTQKNNTLFRIYIIVMSILLFISFICGLIFAPSSPGAPPLPELILYLIIAEVILVSACILFPAFIYKQLIKRNTSQSVASDEPVTLDKPITLDKPVVLDEPIALDKPAPSDK